MATITVDNVPTTITWADGETFQAFARFEIELVDATSIGRPPQHVIGEWWARWKQVGARYPGDLVDISSPFVSGKATSVEAFLFSAHGGDCEMTAVGVDAPTVTITTESILAVVAP